MYKLLRSILFLLPAEKAHKTALSLFEIGLNIPILSSLLKKIYAPSNHNSIELFGLQFKNRVGLAAGFDKNGDHIEAMSVLGFGFIEVGTVTPKPQMGNDQPRLFRLKADQALINRMGFNNNGVDYLVDRLKKVKRSDVVIGGNIGKNKNTANEDAISDYIISFNKLHDHVDYFVINVSSPNTPNLRALQDKEPLTALLQSVVAENERYANPRPILLKIAPDLSWSQIDDVIDIVLSVGVDGIIATNTTINRAGLQTAVSTISEIGNGGLSGVPMQDRSTEVIRYIHDKTAGAITIIGVGGIHDAASAKEKIEAGASLIQLYTGFVYEGPAIVKKLIAATS